MESRKNAASNNDVALARGNATMLILAVLHEGGRHGYEIAREVERRSDNAITFNHGTLYPILQDLEKQGMIVGAWEQPTGERARRVYSLTEAGVGELERHLRKWDALTGAINRVLGRPAGEQLA